MSEEKSQFSVVPDVVKSASDAIHQNLPETVGQADGALSTVVGFFNNVVLYPLKKANLTFRYKLENFEKDLQDKIKNIPEENLQTPPTMIAGPALEALRYAYDEKELREMYENLLASAMDDRKVSQTHPSFVDAIKQMSPLDARVFKAISEKAQIGLAHVMIMDKEEKNWYPKAMPYYFSPELIPLGNQFDVSMSISNLIRLGLVKSTIAIFKDEYLKEIEEHEYIQRIYDQFPKEKTKIKVSGEAISIDLDNYGISFAETCLAEGGK